VLTAAEGGHGGAGSEEEAGGGDAADSEPAANVQTAAIEADDAEGAPVWLAVTALAVGALGLLAGIGGLMAGRRNRA
jgi:hypothetical protein